MQIMNAALALAHARHTESTASPQLKKAASEFEASFLEELLKPMTEDSLFGSSADGSPTGSMGTVSSIAAQALADGIARDGGLGIAKRVLADLTPVEAAQSGTKTTAGGIKCGGCATHLPSLSEAPEDGSDVAAAGQISVGALPDAAEEKPVPVNDGMDRQGDGQDVEKIDTLPEEMHSSTPATGR